MQDIIDYKALVIIGVFFLLFVAELIRPARFFSSFRRIIKNLSFWPINIGLSLLFVIPVTYFATQNPLWVRPEWLSGLSALILDIIILDLFIYAWHRATHEIGFLWRFHEVHHLDEHLDTTSAIRFHYGEILLATCFRLIVILCFSIPFTSVILFETLVFAFSLFHHSNIKLPHRFEKILAKIIVTPSIHWVHHHAIRRDTDSNYGTIFSLWDVLFRTKSATQRFKQMKIGVENLKDKNFMRLFIQPFLKQKR